MEVHTFISLGVHASQMSTYFTELQHLDEVNEYNRPLTEEARLLAESQQDWVRDGLECGEWLDFTVVLQYFSFLNSQRSPEDNCCFVTDPVNPQVIQLNLLRKESSVQILQLDKVFVPVYNGENHYVLMVVDMEQKTLFVYDSLRSQKSRIQKMYGDIAKKVLIYISDMLMACDWQTIHLKENKAIRDWKISRLPEGPHQPNGYDCGVYVCKAAEFINQNISLDEINDGAIDYYRHRMTLDLMVHKKVRPQRALLLPQRHHRTAAVSSEIIDLCPSPITP
jgi:hypothetical protein